MGSPAPNPEALMRGTILAPLFLSIAGALAMSDTATADEKKIEPR